MTDPTQITPVDVDQDLVTEDLIEEVSIDGMCGVY
jgi:mycofactocin precursor